MCFKGNIAEPLCNTYLGLHSICIPSCFILNILRSIYFSLEVCNTYLGVPPNDTVVHHTKISFEPWSSGWGRRFVIRRLWVRIPAPDTGWTFFQFYLLQELYCLFEKTINEKEAGVGPFLKNFLSSIHFSYSIGRFYLKKVFISCRFGSFYLKTIFISSHSLFREAIWLWFLPFCLRLQREWECQFKFENFFVFPLSLSHSLKHTTTPVVDVKNVHPNAPLTSLLPNHVHQSTMVP